MGDGRGVDNVHGAAGVRETDMVMLSGVRQASINHGSSDRQNTPRDHQMLLNQITLLYSMV